MEPQQDTNSNENTVDDEGNERIRSSNASSTSSSTSSSEFQDPQLNSFKKENLQKRSSNEDQGKKDEQEKEPQNGNGSTVQSPPIQTMERPPDNGSGYRIPSYVFARNNTGNQVEWSTTSNESLFSIHTGNTSFTGDKYSWLLEAADMYNIPDEEDSPKTQEIPTPQVSSLESPSSPNDEVVIIVPEKEMENVNTSDGTKPKPFTVEDQATPASSRSNESAHSFAFAFPLAEDRGESVKSVKSVKSSGLSSVPEQQKESSSSLESSAEQNPSPEPEPAKNSLVFSCFASCMACFTRCSKASTDKDSAFKD